MLRKGTYRRIVMQQVFMCPRCGTQNYMGQRFCSGCGSPLATSCPYCGVYMTSSSGFCTSCGAQVGSGAQAGWGAQPQSSPAPVKERKPASGWSKIGTALFILGVLGVIIAPAVILLMMPDAEGSTSLLVKCIAAAVVAVVVGIPLMFKG